MGEILDKLLDKQGLTYYDEKSKEYIKEQINIETERAKKAEYEIDKNTFNNINVGSNTISAKKRQDTLTLESIEDIIILSADKNKNKITVSLDTSKLFVKSEAMPTTIGTLGDIIYNSNPISGDYVGWIYTLSGWAGFGKIEIVNNGIELSDGNALVLSNGELFLTSDE